MRVLLMSHQNKTDKKGELIPGNDYILISQIYNILKGKGYDDDLLMLNGSYDAATSKAIIGCFDILISGRTHGAVAGWSQYIPTVIIDYGHEPIAHKLRGFARTVGMEQYLCSPINAADMINKVADAWNKRNKIKQELRVKVRDVQFLAEVNFKLLHKLVN